MPWKLTNSSNFLVSQLFGDFGVEFGAVEHAEGLGGGPPRREGVETATHVVFEGLDAVEFFVSELDVVEDTTLSFGVFFDVIFC